MPIPIDKFERTVEFLNAFLDNNFENYIELQNFIEKHINDNQQILDEKFNEASELDFINETNTSMDKFDIEHGTNLYRFDHEFPNRTRYFLITQTHSMLEVYFKWFCEKLQSINKNPIGISDLKGSSDLEKGKLYLRRIYNIDFSQLEPEWSFLNDMRKIRNQIIHNNGKFRTKDSEILRIINKIPELGRLWDEIYPELDDNEEYEIKINSKELNIKYVENVKIFFRKIIKEIKVNR
jgi:hypothetical protein